jgi:hypothetical protein
MDWVRLVMRAGRSAQVGSRALEGAAAMARALALLLLATTSASFGAQQPPSNPRAPGECRPGERPGCFDSADGFRWLHPLPHGHTLLSVWTLRRGEAWAVGEQALVQRSVDGQTGRVASPPIPLGDELGKPLPAGFVGASLEVPPLREVVATGPGELWVGWGEGVARLDGARWTVERSNRSFYSLLVGPDRSLWSIDSYLLRPPRVRAEDGWREGPKPPDTKGIVTAAAASSREVLLASLDDGFFTGSLVAPFRRLAVPAPEGPEWVAAWLDWSGSRGLVVSRFGETLERTEAGWAVAAPLGKPDGDESTGREIVRAVWGVPGGAEQWAVGDRVFRRAHGRWQRVPIAGFEERPVPQPRYGNDPIERFQSVHGSGADDVWVVGRSGFTLHWDGKSLAEVSRHCLEGELLGVFAVGEAQLVAPSSDGRLLTVVADEARCQEGPSRWLAEAFVTRSGELIVMDREGRFFLRDPETARWTLLARLDYPGMALVAGAGGASRDDFFVTGAGGYLAHFDGKRFVKVKTPTE